MSSAIPGIPGELVNLYQRYFGKSPVVIPPPPSDPSTNSERISQTNQQTGDPLYSPKGAVLQEKYYNVDIWLPITLKALPTTFINANNGNSGEWYLPYATVSVSGSAEMIKTSLNQQKGKVKELYSIDDDIIRIKGFLIDKKYRSFPEVEIGYLKMLRQLGTSFKIDNAITNIFLEDTTLPPDQQYRVVMERFDLPEVTGGRKSMRPFSMELSSDYIFTLTRS